LGQLLLLAGVTYLLYLVEEDLRLAGSFADYLHKSNVAFTMSVGGEYISSPGDEHTQVEDISGDVELVEYLDHRSTTVPPTSPHSILSTSITPHNGHKKVVVSSEDVEACCSLDSIYSSNLKEDFGGR